MIFCNVGSRYSSLYCYEWFVVCLLVFFFFQGTKESHSALRNFDGVVRPGSFSVCLYSCLVIWKMRKTM